MSASNQLEGSKPPTSKGGNAKVTSGTGPVKLRKSSVTPSPSDTGSSKNGKG